MFKKIIANFCLTGPMILTHLFREHSIISAFVMLYSHPLIAQESCSKGTGTPGDYKYGVDHLKSCTWVKVQNFHNPEL